MKEIFFRVDVNDKIATGHAMRCISIAREFVRNGNKIIFIVADEKGQEFIQTRGFETICLNTKWNELDNEIVILSQLIHNNGIKKLIIDSYYVTPSYLSEINKLCEVIYIDDLNMFPYPVSTVVNYSVYADDFNYEINYRKVGLSTKFLLGCDYVPLREEFINVDYKVKEEVKKILITTGGSDNLNLAGKIANHFRQRDMFNGIELHIIVGAYNRNENYLEELSGKYGDIVLHKNVSNMSKLMQQCDIAISAGGSTLYELCACGIPTICFSFADNQIPGVKGMANVEAMIGLEDVRLSEERFLLNVEDSVERLMDAEIRECFSKKMKMLVDGQGTKRLLKQLIY